MSGILKIKRGGVDVGLLNDGEFYLNKNINAIQIGSGSAILTLVPLNQTITGDIILNGNIYADNLNISSSYATTSSYAHFAQTTGNVLTASYSDVAASAYTASYILSSNVFGPHGFNSILTASVALSAPGYLLVNDTSSMLNPYLFISGTGSMLSPYTLNSQTSSFVNNNQTGSFITNTQTSSFLLNNQTGSMLSSYVLNSQTTSFVTNTQTGSFITNTQTGSFITNAQTSSMSVGTASFATTASYAQTASLALGVVGFGNLASSSYPFDVTGSTIYSHYSNKIGSTTLPITSINRNFIVGESAALRGYYTSSIILGFQAGYQVVEETGSSFNVFLGNEAGARSRDVVLSFLGLYRAGYQSQTNNSIFIGREAGAYTGLSNDSIFLGRRAGFRQTNVSHSILIGYNVGAAFPTTTDPIGSNNIIIGSNITLPPATRNSINLGGIIFGSGTYSEQAGNPLDAAVSNGKIGINVYPNNYNFEVNGTANISNGLYVTNSINLTGSNNHIGNYILTGSINTTGSNTFTGNTTISGSLYTTGSNTFSGQQTISGSLNIVNDLVVLGSASFYYFSTTFVTTSIIVATGSNQLGDTVDDIQTLIGTVNISGSLAVTGSAFLTASNVAGGQNNYIARWNSNNSLTTGSLYETGSNILIGTTTNPSNDFKLYVSGNIGLPSYQISSISASNNLNYVGIWRPSGSQGNTNFLETTESIPRHKWVFRDVEGFNQKRNWDSNESSIVNINLGWGNASQTLFTGSSLLINPHINITNGFATSIRGIYYNPTISASVNTNHIAIETATGSIIFRNLPTSSTVQNVVLYDSTSGQLFYTASSGVIGGGGSAGTGSNTTGSFTTQSIWNFNHNLNNKYVLVQTYDTNWNQIIPEAITLTDANTTTISFPTSESGYAIAMLGGEVSLSNYLTNSQTSSFLLVSQTGSMLVPYLLTTQTSSFITNLQTSSFITNLQTSSMTVATASFVNTLNQNVLITGSLTVGSSSLGPSENTLTLAAKDNGSEGGQIGFNAPGGTYTSASYIDNFQNQLRILKGTNITSTDTLTTINLQTGNITLTTGSIIMPTRPAFRVIGTGGSISSTTTISGSAVTVDFNQGSHYNQTTGKFTAPIAGLYQVNVVCRTAANNNAGINQIIVKKQLSGGGATTAQIMLEWAANTSVNHMGGSTVSNLAVGDTLWVDVTAGTISFDGNDNFSVAYIG